MKTLLWPGASNCPCGVSVAHTHKNNNLKEVFLLDEQEPVPDTIPVPRGWLEGLLRHIEAVQTIQDPERHWRYAKLIGYCQSAKDLLK